MQTMPLEQAEGCLAEIVEKLSPGEEIVFDPAQPSLSPGWSGRSACLGPVPACARP